LRIMNPWRKCCMRLRFTHAENYTNQAHGPFNKPSPWTLQQTKPMDPSANQAHGPFNKPSPWTLQQTKPMDPSTNQAHGPFNKPSPWTLQQTKPMDCVPWEFVCVCLLKKKIQKQFTQCSGWALGFLWWALEVGVRTLN